MMETILLVLAIVFGLLFCAVALVENLTNKRPLRKPTAFEQEVLDFLESEEKVLHIRDEEEKTKNQK